MNKPLSPLNAEITSGRGIATGFASITESSFSDAAV